MKDLFELNVKIYEIEERVEEILSDKIYRAYGHKIIYDQTSLKKIALYWGSPNKGKFPNHSGLESVTPIIIRLTINSSELIRSGNGWRGVGIQKYIYPEIDVHVILLFGKPEIILISGSREWVHPLLKEPSKKRMILMDDWMI